MDHAEQREVAAAVRGGAADVAILRAPFDQRGLDTELLLTEPRVAVLPAGHRLADRPELRRADLAGEPTPRWAGQSDPVAAAYWTGTDTPTPARNQYDHPPGPEINHISQLLDAVALGNAVAYVPVSAADRYRSAGLAVVPVSDLSPSEIVAAWPETSRSRAVAGSSARPSKWRRSMPSRRQLSPDPGEPEPPSVS